MKARWRDVFVDSVSALMALTTNITTSSQQLIESFIIVITPEDLISDDTTAVQLEDMGAEVPFACNSIKDWWKALSLLANELSNMTLLRSLSLTVPPATENERPLGFFISKRIICAMVGKLPLCVEDSELVTGGMERSTAEHPQHHLFSQLRECLRSLKHGRLSLGLFCPQLFASRLYAQSAESSQMTPANNDRSELHALAPDT